MPPNIPLMSPAMSSKIQSLWHKAAEDPSLSSQQRQILDDLKITQPSDNMCAINTMIEGILKKKERKWKIKFRGKKVVLRHVWMKILHWLDRFKEIGDIIMQFDPVHAALPWAGIRFLLKLCVDKQATVEAILIGLEKIAHLIDRSTYYVLLYLHANTTASQRLERSILGLFTAILKFVANAIHRLNDSHLKAVFTTETISDDLRDVEKFEQRVGCHVDAAEAECKIVPQVFKKFCAVRWISNIPYTEHHARISEGRLAGIGEWLFNKEEYRNWRATSALKLLLLRGISGAGKTYIASSVIDSFLKTPAEKLAYFYCNRAKKNCRESEKILATLIQQLAQTGSEEGLLTPVVNIYNDQETKGQTSAQLSIRESQDLLVQILNIYPQTTICIDAMDEVDNDMQIDLLEYLNDIIYTLQNVLKIFVTTRMDIDILMQFEIFPRIELQPDDNVDNINGFVQTKVKTMINCKQLLYGKVSNELK
ncbi:hypothetical protein EV426DRAFT_679800, partial [Tirmania nivea]